MSTVSALPGAELRQTGRFVPSGKAGCALQARGAAPARGSAQTLAALLPAPRKPSAKRECVLRLKRFLAAEPTAASGGNREARLGPRSDFCEAAQGRSIKSAKRNPFSFFSKKEEKLSAAAASRQSCPVRRGSVPPAPGAGGTGRGCATGR